MQVHHLPARPQAAGIDRPTAGRGGAQAAEAREAQPGGSALSAEGARRSVSAPAADLSQVTAVVDRQNSLRGIEEISSYLAETFSAPPSTS